MIPVVLLLQLALWTLSASAFYPYTPIWLKEKEKDEIVLHGQVKNSATSGKVRDGQTFKIEKKRKQNIDPPALLAAKQAIWLKEKFRHTRFGAPGNTVEKRANTYKVMEGTQPSEAMAAGIDQDGTDFSYFVKAELGSKGKPLYLLVDTGAGSSWVMGSSCTGTPCSMHTTFGQGDSGTFSDGGKPFSILYGSGKVQGKLFTDTISVAGISVKFTFGQASKASDDFSSFAFDGILGMSMGKSASDNFLETLADAKKLPKNIFGIHLSRASDGSNQGEIKFGSTNPNKYTGHITYTSVGSKNGEWAIPIDDMAYDGKKAGAGGVLSYIDTGTSFIFGPPDLTKKIHDTIPGASSSDGLTYTVPCNSDKSLVFTFSGVDYKLSPKDWISPKDSSGKCTSNLYGHEVVKGAWLLGDTFLKNVYAVFDADEKRIGFAVTAGSYSGGSSSTQTTASPTTSMGPSLGLDGHETASTGSSSAAAKPTESTKSRASDLNSQQNAKLAVLMFFAALVACVVA